MPINIGNDKKESCNFMVKKIKASLIIVILMVCFLLAKKVLSSNISSIEDFQELMNGYGIWGPVVLTVIQALQVVIPILPGYLGCAVGAMSFGPLVGFICNYIGISLGSIIAFFLAYHFGKPLVLDLFSEKQYEKWKQKIKGKKSYDAFLFIATLLPMFPDDFLCYFSGLIEMNKRRFIGIIILGKPWCILAYSIIFGLIK